eukprot:gene8225-9072_t
MEDLSDRRMLHEKRSLGEEMKTISMMSEEEIFHHVSPVTVSMSCPPEKVGPLIGKKGVVVQEIMKRSSCRVYVDQNYPEGHPRVVQITGHPRELSLAVALIALVMERGPSIISPAPLLSREGSAQESSLEVTDNDFLCPPAKVGVLIGPKGVNVQDIFRRTGCRIQVLQDGVPDGVDRRVCFTGLPQQILAAKAMASHLLSGGVLEGSLSASLSGSNSLSSSVPADPSATVKVVECDVDPEKVRLVIGSKGVTIGEIMKRSCCKVFINQNFPEGQMHKVVYTGTPQQIDIARYLVDTVVSSGMSALYAVLNGTDSIIFQEMPLSQSQLNQLAEKDTVINDLQDKYSVKINVDLTASLSDEAATTRLSVIGRVDNVHLAVKALCHSLGVNLLDSQTDRARPCAGSMLAASSSGPILALGKDGTAGHLEAAVNLLDGNLQQVAEIKNEVMGRVVGARSSNIALIKAKSGASIQVLKTDNSKGTTRVLLSGSAQSVGLAAQMVQEVLVNGPAKLLRMNDAAVDSFGGAKALVEGPFYGQPSTISAVYPALTIPEVNYAPYIGSKRPLA